MGYVPADQVFESVSRTQEYAYDDWASSHIARAAGASADADRLLKRSGNWRNVDKFNQALAGAAEMLDGQPEVMEGPMVAGQQYIAVSKEGEEGFFARFVLGGGTQEGKTYDDVAEFMTNTVYPAYENVEGIYGTGACKVSEDKGFSFNFWTDHDAAHAASDVIASVVSDAVANLISEPPQEITGQCNIWKNYVDFPVGKL